MIDLEKVINGLETVFMHLLKMTEVCSDGDLTYYRELLERTDDALTLLKAQEPKSPIIKENSYGWKFYYCPSCGKEFYQNNKFSFCEKCGQAVKWE